MCGKNLPTTCRSRDTAHAQWLQMHCHWYPIREMSELMTQERIAIRIFKLGGWIDHVTRRMTTDQGQKVRCPGREVM